MDLLKKLSLALVLLLSAALVSGPLGCAGQEETNMPIVLLTDYGSEDYRICQLKGIIYSNNPTAILVDASQGIPAFDIHAGAFILDIAAKEFPENVVFVGVVAPYDPLGTRYLLLKTSKNQYFVLPDNGLLTYVIENMGVDIIYQVTNQELFSGPIENLSAEEVQGKVGALIASGYRPDDVGVQLANPKTLDIQEPSIADGRLLGTVVYVDHYGNCVTNIPGGTAEEFGLKLGDTIVVKGPQLEISAKFGSIYSDVPQGEEIVFVKSDLGMLQLSVNLGDFAETYGIEAGTKVEIEM